MAATRTDEVEGVPDVSPPKILEDNPKADAAAAAAAAETCATDDGALDDEAPDDDVLEFPALFVLPAIVPGGVCSRPTPGRIRRL